MRKPSSKGQCRALLVVADFNKIEDLWSAGGGSLHHLLKKNEIIGNH